ncbi:MAG: hemerythrin domain-containing protein [Rhodospirillaceae bacterium]|jgi:hemerythrin-like domain-containing protein|nr:hemerythrin domain-containing protein [Rhodospirillaceae bacterium]MBT4589011.1 hemerythrin domain-containing protein [Rhodospirillaceae bacterium]MBT5940841.1 hemerythrin domain-containing protein [Rhodospirillaceae bacterium]MBT7266695.1 hemerythrin domain-containing protein [Rhodospirillaceae bacterium]
MDDLELELCKSLHKDHMITLQLLERLETTLGPKSSDLPDTTGGDFRNLLTDLVTVLEAEVKGHFAFEEEHLFPRFADEIDPAITEMLQGEHEIIRPIATQLTDLARAALKEGFTPDNWDEFRNAGLELVEREVFHVQKEEMGFLPGLDEILDEDEDRELNMMYLSAT